METVWIDDLVEIFEETNMDWKTYLNRKTGEYIDVPLKEEDLEEYSQEEKDLFLEIDALRDYIVLPDQKALKEFDIMEAYANDTYNTGIQKRLLYALKNGKPFRNFRAQIRLLNLEDDYTSYRSMVFAAKARTWCMEHSISYDVENEDFKEYFKEIEEDERIEKELNDFEDAFNEFEYDE